MHFKTLIQAFADLQHHQGSRSSSPSLMMPIDRQKFGLSYNKKLKASLLLFNIS